MRHGVALPHVIFQNMTNLIWLGHNLPIACDHAFFWILDQKRSCRLQMTSGNGERSEE